MFVSFFPNPKPFFWSALVWTALAIALWYLGARDAGAWIGLPPAAPEAPPIVGPAVFVSAPFLWFYIYYAIVVGLFAAAWMTLRPHPWQNWSILGTALIIFVTYFQVEVSVAINAWRLPFFNMIQDAVSKARVVPLEEYYSRCFEFFSIAGVAVIVAALNFYFVQHYVFRWRTAMNEFYVSHWPKLRHVEGASQRIQDDTMRFARETETLGGSLIDAVMTLIAFLPVLVVLSQSVPELPLIGAIPYSLVFLAIAWAAFGTVLLALVGLKLPGLEFRNQRVEAAYRKELVYGEDHQDRAEPITLAQLFTNVRKNYFTLYFHYMYFNVVRISYQQADAIIVYVALAPTLVAGRITLGLFQQITGAFEQVASSFQYLVTSWPRIVELISIYKRLRAFEAVIHGGALPSQDLETPEAEVDASGVRA